MNKKKVTHNDIINMIYYTWYDKEKVSEEIIKKSFIVAGITEDFIKNKSKIKFTWLKELLPLVDMKKYLLENLKEQKDTAPKIIYSIDDDFNNDEKETKSYQPKITDIFLKK